MGDSTRGKQVGEARGPEGSDGPDPAPWANLDAHNDARIGPPWQIHLPVDLRPKSGSPRGAGVARGGAGAGGELGRSAEPPGGSQPPPRSLSPGAILHAPRTA